MDNGSSRELPAITAVSLFHVFHSWSDLLPGRLYLSGKPDLQTLPFAIPVVIFFLAQRAFMRGVVITGVEK